MPRTAAAGAPPGREWRRRTPCVEDCWLAGGSGGPHPLRALDVYGSELPRDNKLWTRGRGHRSAASAAGAAATCKDAATPLFYGHLLSAPLCVTARPSQRWRSSRCSPTAPTALAAAGGAETGNAVVYFFVVRPPPTPDFASFLAFASARLASFALPPAARAGRRS